MPPQERKRRVRRVVLGVGVLLLVLVGAATAFVVTREPDDVFDPDVEFREEPAPTPEPELEPEQPGKKKTRRVDRFIWAHYGYTRDRRRYLPLKKPPRPPFKEVWRFQGRVLLEFPPVIAGTRLFLLKDNGRLVALDKHSGRSLWRRKLGALAAASPAYADGTVYVVLLQRTKSGRGADVGRVVSLDAGNGKIRWSRELSSRSESSPLIDGNRLYFGSESGTVYSMNARDGGVRWRFQADGSVKGGLALADGKLYFGDYGGRVYALDQDSGRQVWRSSTSGTRFGLGSGNFYSTPAVAHGRVYIGNTDGRMYSFSAASGRLAWSRSTGGYVYASPAVAQLPGRPPLVYAGSYDGTFYAFDARNGNVRWSRGGNGRISGGASVIGDIVYYADLGNRRSIGLDARSGRKVFEFPSGSYNPVVSDGETIFLTGFTELYALQPLTAQGRKQRRVAAATRAQRRRADRRHCRQRARRIHRGRKRAQQRSVKRCLERRARVRRKAGRARCLREARREHKGKPRKLRRYYRDCIWRRGVWRH